MHLFVDRMFRDLKDVPMASVQWLPVKSDRFVPYLGAVPEERDLTAAYRTYDRAEMLVMSDYPVAVSAPARYTRVRRISSGAESDYETVYLIATTKQGRMLYLTDLSPDGVPNSDVLAVICT